MTAPTNPSFDIAHLGHVEMFTDRYDESLDFFTRIYGLKLSGEDSRSAYLRAWDDYEFCTLKLTRADTTGVGHIGYRAASPEALERRVAAIEDSGYRVHGWIDGDMSHGRAFRFEDPFGHVFEIYYETVRFAAEGDETPALKNTASAVDLHTSWRMISKGSNITLGNKHSRTTELLLAVQVCLREVVECRWRIFVYAYLTVELRWRQYVLVC